MARRQLIPLLLTIFLAACAILGTRIAKSQTPVPSTGTPVPPTSPPTPTLSVEQRISIVENQLGEMKERVENPPKDVWDKISSVSGLITGGIVVVIGIFVTYLYNERQRKVEEAHNIAEEMHNKRELAVLQVQTVQSFMPQLQSGKSKEIEAALLGIAALGNPDLATRLANLYRTEGAVSALDKLAKSHDQQVAQKAAKSLMELSLEGEQRISRLMKHFNEQQVPGELFGLSGSVLLPAFTSVHHVGGPRDKGVDIEAESARERWLVQVKIGHPSLSYLYSIPGQFPPTEDQETKIWLVVLSDIKPSVEERFAREGFLISSLEDLEVLEQLIG